MKNIITGAIAVVAVVAGVSFFGKTTVNVPAPVVNVSVPEQKTPVVNVGAPVVNVPKSQTLGAATGPDISSPYLSFGNVTRWANQTTLAQATSTVCALQSPAATSTLDKGVVRFQLASTSAISFDIAKGNTQYATTTVIGSSGAIGAGVAGVYIASSTSAEALTFSPSTWFIVRFNSQSSTTGGGNAPVGVCQAVWTQI